MKFLFHTGSIKRGHYEHTVETGVEFLFHTGSIKRGQPMLFAAARLDKFLFHTGSIKSLSGWRSRHRIRGSFYSILVRLKALGCDKYFEKYSSFYSILVRLKGVPSTQSRSTR